MAWEKKKRGKGKYYYRAERRGGQVVKQYMGSGPKAIAAAKADAAVKNAREADKTAADALAADLAKLDDIEGQAADEVELMVQAGLIVAGFYQHHGTWRRRGSDNKKRS